MGLIILPLMALYLALLLGATLYGWYRAKRRGYSKKKRALYALYGFLIVYLPVMWDWIPTELAYRYYCKKEAGLWIYKTIDQWKAENPGVLETLVFNKDRPFETVYSNKKGRKYVNFLNERISYSSETKRIFYFLPLIKDIDEVIDTKNNEVLAKHVDFGYSGGNPALGGFKPWMNRPFCSGKYHLTEEFFNFEEILEGAKK